MKNYETRSPKILDFEAHVREYSYCIGNLLNKRRAFLAICHKQATDPRTISGYFHRDGAIMTLAVFSHN